MQICLLFHWILVTFLLQLELIWAHLVVVARWTDMKILSRFFLSRRRVVVGERSVLMTLGLPDVLSCAVRLPWAWLRTWYFELSILLGRPLLLWLLHSKVEGRLLGLFTGHACDLARLTLLLGVLCRIWTINTWHWMFEWISRHRHYLNNLAFFFKWWGSA